MCQLSKSSHSGCAPPAVVDAWIVLGASLSAFSAFDGDSPDVEREPRLRDLGERFLAAKAGRAPSTVEAYERAARKFITSRIGDLAVSEAAPDRLQRSMDTITAEVG